MLHSKLSNGIICDIQQILCVRSNIFNFVIFVDSFVCTNPTSTTFFSLYSCTMLFLHLLSSVRALCHEFEFWLLCFQFSLPWVFTIIHILAVNFKRYLSNVFSHSFASLNRKLIWINVNPREILKHTSL